MKAAPEDRLHAGAGRGGFPTKRVALVVIIIAVLLLMWTTRLEKEVADPVPQPVIPAEIEVEEVELPPAPDIPPRPAPEPEPTAEVPEPVVPMLPPLEESDDLAREQLAAAGVGAELQQLQKGDNLVQRTVALVDGFSRGLVIRKMLPLPPPEGAFSVEHRGEQMFMNPAGYARYDDFARAIAELDSKAMVESFHQMRPLYEQAYGQLGLSPGDFDNAVIRTLDRVLATPEIEGPIPLARKSVMYLYADPALEQLAPLQKQLLRMGPDNLRLIKQQAGAIRAGLLAQE